MCNMWTYGTTEQKSRYLYYYYQYNTIQVYSVHCQYYQHNLQREFSVPQTQNVAWDVGLISE